MDFQRELTYLIFSDTTAIIDETGQSLTVEGHRDRKNHIETLIMSSRMSVGDELYKKYGTLSNLAKAAALVVTISRNEDGYTLISAPRIWKVLFNFDKHLQNGLDPIRIVKTERRYSYPLIKLHACLKNTPLDKYGYNAQISCGDSFPSDLSQLTEDRLKYMSHINILPDKCTTCKISENNGFLITHRYDDELIIQETYGSVVVAVSKNSDIVEVNLRKCFSLGFEPEEIDSKFGKYQNKGTEIMVKGEWKCSHVTIPLKKQKETIDSFRRRTLFINNVLLRIIIKNVTFIFENLENFTMWNFYMLNTEEGKFPSLKEMALFSVVYNGTWETETDVLPHEILHNILDYIGPPVEKVIITD
jgi:hypothetical protein